MSDRKSDMFTEVELKLRIAPEHTAKLLRHPLLKGLARSKPVTQRLYSIYYDTPGLDLWRHGVALRLRRVGPRWVQTIKGGGSAAAGLHQRDEWETEVANQRLDLTKLDDPRLGELFGSAELQKQLHPVFVTEFSRVSRLLELGDGQAEFSLDRGELRTDSLVQPISEIELELKSGSPGRLYDVALELVKTIPLKLENASKAERGYRLLTGQSNPPLKASASLLTPGMSVNDAFKSIIWACLAHLQGNEPGMIAGAGPEYLHQMRIALRRMRSAFGIFLPVFGKEMLAPPLQELKWLTAQLGPARDWDVFATEMLPPVCVKFPDHQRLAALGQECERRRQNKNAIGREAVQSLRYQELLLRFGAWLTGEPWLGQLGSPALDALAAPASKFAAEVLEKRHRQVKRRGRDLAGLSAEKLHALRIACKKSRYAAEFFAALYPQKAIRGYLRAVTALQDVLGHLNDAATARNLLAELVTEGGDKELQEAAGLVIGWTARAADLRLADLKRAWKRFGEEKPFWKASS